MYLTTSLFREKEINLKAAWNESLEIVSQNKRVKENIQKINGELVLAGKAVNAVSGLVLAINAVSGLVLAVNAVSGLVLNIVSGLVLNFVSGLVLAVNAVSELVLNAVSELVLAVNAVSGLVLAVNAVSGQHCTYI